MIIAITNCRSMKQTYKCSAEEMYSKSYVFRAQKDFFKLAYDNYYILSSYYGVIPPTKIIEPYKSLHLPKISRVKLDGDWTQNQLEMWVNSSVGYIEQLLSNNSNSIIHFYVTLPYWNLIKKHFKNNPRVKHIKQQRNNPVGQRKYEEAFKMFSNGKSLEECITHVSTLDKGTYETEKWFYHLNEDSFYGKSHQLARKYEWADEGALHRVSLSKNPHHKGWVIDQSLLGKLYKTESGQWRVKKS
ncbi:MAG: hypothetical protein GY823_01425 [Flavobacteriaceae bacterium]|nr:hypothetical protein [Flavobacteriaceae bacterium]